MKRADAEPSKVGLNQRARKGTRDCKSGGRDIAAAVCRKRKD